jgi:hypothetical protein
MPEVRAGPGSGWHVGKSIASAAAGRRQTRIIGCVGRRARQIDLRKIEVDVGA